MKKAITGMSPRQTWDYYVDMAVEFFISASRYDVPELDPEGNLGIEIY
ncbi:MAG: hypothetical protein GX380_07770 [Tissierellia bacterium]|jgi:hypothetical protein|nr:hypothetical protein [Tissierellia bacterium]